MPGVSVDDITRRVLNGIEKSQKSIILLHDGNMTHPSDKSKTVEALDIILDELSKKGYSFTTLEEIMKQNTIGKNKFRKYFYP